ncbi:hypothetical protein N7462_008791 [Penicillium macrosclerotiorum]|uniref:uncharacterized protein n=1 Tax=Penicillium macrosclerotiorum TaxID=303699 RepID=UPI002546FB97|nr:uncharacterized protein N7462_008791 [Penicillium macrosclerotiorum]KAJ5675894.1 hypothetical protein N7462_008791 [Penicillium macrosclerotiorum]
MATAPQTTREASEQAYDYSSRAPPRESGSNAYGGASGQPSRRDTRVGFVLQDYPTDEARRNVRSDVTASDYSAETRLVKKPGQSRTNDRRFLVKRVSTDLEGLQVAQMFQGFESTNGPFLPELNTKGRFYVAFADISEAKRAVQVIESSHPEWELVPIPAEDFNRETRLASPLPPNFDDQVLITLYCGNHSNVNPSNIVARLKPFFELVGRVYSIQELLLGNSSGLGRLTTHELIVRYYNTHHALNAVRTLNAIRTEDFVIEVMPWHQGMESQPIRHWTSTIKGRRLSHPSQYGTPGRRAYMSPGGDPDSSPIIPDRTSISKDNVIDLGKIYYGQDGRTSVMLRNIPNPMVWLNLKGILDQTSRNRYDFLYLRMDFEMNQNVGYAFVNFADAVDIIPFVEARDGACWPGYDNFTDKVAEISYATVQGKDALIEKFRNSPVILNSYNNRPKLFHLSGPRIGGEATFPPVNNFYTLSKGVDRSKRSGLYRSENRNISRSGPTPAPGTQYHRYSDSNSEGSLRGEQDLERERERARELGSPVRASRTQQSRALETPGTMQLWKPGSSRE